MDIVKVLLVLFHINDISKYRISVKACWMYHSFNRVGDSYNRLYFLGYLELNICNCVEYVRSDAFVRLIYKVVVALNSFSPFLNIEIPITDQSHYVILKYKVTWLVCLNYLWIFIVHVENGDSVIPSILSFTRSF